MKKIVYYVGIYSICVGIHEGLGILTEKIREYKSNGEHKKKGTIGIQSTPAKKPMNKIGFEIPQV